MRVNSRTPIAPTTTVIGLDIAKGKFVAVALAGDGTRSKARPFRLDATGLVAFEDFIEQAAAGAKGIVVGFEPTGHYGEPLLERLHDSGMPLYLVQPHQTKRAKDLYGRNGRKTDAKDAFVVAKIVRDGGARPWGPSGAPFSGLRLLCRQREQLVVRRGSVRNRLHRHLDVVFPELASLFGKLDSPSCMYMVRTVPVPTDVLAASKEALAEGLFKASHHNLGMKRVREVCQAAERSVGIGSDLAVHRLAISQCVEELDFTSRLIERVEEEIRLLVAQVDYADRLLTVPALGEMTTAILLGEFGDLRGYRHAKQLIAMAGLDLSERSSGKHQGALHISRRGRRYLRQTLYLAALRMGWEAFSAHRQRLVEENKLKKIKATVANMRRLLRVLHAMVRDDEDFDAAMHAAPMPEAMVA